MKKVVMAQSLLEALQAVPDHRSPHGRRHPLPAILALATAAMLSGARSLYGIWQWGRLQKPELVSALGFSRHKTPAVSTLHLVFSQLDVSSFELALQSWTQANLDEEEEAIAIDGKGLKGIHGEKLPGVRLVGACSNGG
jgi:hypothetical protein